MPGQRSYLIAKRKKTYGEGPHLEPSDTVTLPIAPEVFWGSGGLILFIIACGMVVLILNQVSSNPLKGNAEDYIAALGLKKLPVIITFIISLIWLVFLIVFLGGAGWALVDIFGNFGQQDTDLRWSLLTLAGMKPVLKNSEAGLQS